MGEAGPSSSVLRWGILGTGWISTMFTTDVLVQRLGAPAKHLITAIGSSSKEKGNSFVERLWKDSVEPRPKVYDSYHCVYDDPNVDIVYVGTPHSLHKENCLGAIAAGKHVLCEKPFTINEREAQEVFHAAKAKGVFIMEALWTRFFPLFQALREEIYVKKTIGEVQRLLIDFGNFMPLTELPPNSRLKDPNLGAGALLDIGVYVLTYASLIMGQWKVGKDHPPAEVISSLSIANGFDDSGTVILRYGRSDNSKPDRTAICTMTFHCKSSRDFAKIEGAQGSITIFGPAASAPRGFRVRKGLYDYQPREVPEETFQFDTPSGTLGFFYEADAVASDIAHGRTQSSIMPIDETLRMMRVMDGIRRDNGLLYPQDRQ